MVRHPTDVAMFNGKSTEGLQKLGFTHSDYDSFQKTVRHLKYGLNADDFIQLDWFLYLVSEGRIVIDNVQQIAAGHPNTILYGPPGTGKTYSTMERAVAICDGHVSDVREELVKRYQALREVNRIVFITFHQSYGYEEFVEGIRPVLEDGESDQTASEGNVRYECRDGIFKKLCSLAKGTLSKPKQKYDFDQGEIRIWKMSLGDTQDPGDAGLYDECIEGGYALLGYGKGLDFSQCTTRDAVKEKLQSVDPTITADAHFRQTGLAR